MDGQEITTPVESISNSAAMVRVIERAAADPNIDVEKLERMLAMQERILDRQASQAFSEAMKACQEEMPKVLRNKKNDQTKSKYADLEKVNETIVPIYTKHGFSISFGTDNSPLEGHYRITAEVRHNEGHAKNYFADVPADKTGLKGNDNKTATHAFGSTMSYGRRYLTMLIFNIATTDDTDGNGLGKDYVHGFVTDEQKQELVDLMRETGSDTKKFLAYMRVDNLDVLPASQFAAAKAALEKKRKSA